MPTDEPEGASERTTSTCFGRQFSERAVSGAWAIEDRRVFEEEEHSTVLVLGERVLEKPQWRRWRRTEETLRVAEQLFLQLGPPEVCGRACRLPRLCRLQVGGPLALLRRLPLLLEALTLDGGAARLRRRLRVDVSAALRRAAAPQNETKSSAPPAASPSVVR